MQKVVILKSAENDLQDLKAYLIEHFGKASWQKSYGSIKAAIRQIQQFPNQGKVPDELAQVHLVQYRQVSQIRTRQAKAEITAPSPL